jgi:NAD(P)-dependent dehydrogenase (short-subunit alcohol dehydrogenase family)
MDQVATNAIDLTRRFAGEVAIVTGGAGGIGRAVAERLCAEGAKVAILDIDEAAAAKAATALSDSGYDVVPLACDVRKRAEVQAAIDATVQKFGDITVLINNAGIVRRASFLELADETWDDVIGINLKGAFIVAQEVARTMAKRRSGRIVNMASVAAEIAHSNQTAYSVSKAGVAAMTRVMAFELAPLGITVNALAPGTIATNFALGSLPESGRRSRLDRIPLSRFGSASEVAAAVAFLASADAAYVTGAVLRIDGGLVTGGVRDTPGPIE